MRDRSVLSYITTKICTAIADIGNDQFILVSRDDQVRKECNSFAIAMAIGYNSPYGDRAGGSANVSRVAVVVDIGISRFPEGVLHI